MEAPEIVFEDETMMVLNKPAGWISNSASTTGSQPVVQDWLKKSFEYEIARMDEFRSGVVHRLDKETSGCLLVAKTKTAFFELQKQFKERRVKKSYVALAHGKIFPKMGEIKASVGRLPWRRDRFGVVPGGRGAETNYEVKDYYEKKDSGKSSEIKEYSLVELFPKTGRTHQIRIHLKYLGHPIVSDDFYAGRKTAIKDRKWCERLFLHARSISLVHPKTKKEVSFNADLPSDLKDALKTLQKTD